MWYLAYLTNRSLISNMILFLERQHYETLHAFCKKGFDFSNLYLFFKTSAVNSRFKKIASSPCKYIRIFFWADRF